MSSPIIYFVETVGVCASLDGSGYNMATALMFWKTMKSTDWLVVMSERFAQLLPFFMGLVPFLFALQKKPLGWSTVKKVIPDAASSFCCSVFTYSIFIGFCAAYCG